MCNRVSLRFYRWRYREVGAASGVERCPQYKIGTIFWPEIENNATYYMGDQTRENAEFRDARADGEQTQVEERSEERLALIFGAGEQIATSHYHGYSYGLIFTAACLLRNFLPHGPQMTFPCAMLTHFRLV